MLTIAPNPFLSDNLVAEASTECDHRTLRGGIIQQLRMSNCEIDARVEDDRRLALTRLLQFRYGGLREVKERVDIGVECGVPLLSREGNDVGVGRLCSVIKNQGVQFPVKFDVFGDKLLAGGLGSKVRWYKKYFPGVGCFGVDCLFHVLGLLFFFRKISHRQVRSFEG